MSHSQGITCLTCGSDNAKRGMNRRRTAHITECKSCNALEESPHGRDWRTFAPSHSRSAQDARAGAGAGITNGASQGTGKSAGKDSVLSLLSSTTRRAFPLRTQYVVYSNSTSFNNSFGNLYFFSDKPPHIPSAGVTVGELIGWRFWLIENGRIRSVVTDKIWEPNADQTRAAMEGDVDQVVMNDWIWRYKIYGGVFAWKTEQQAREHMQEAVNQYFGSDVEIITVMGQVDLWGDVIEHERGYRAQYARPLSFTETHSNRPGDLSRNYLLDRLNAIWGLTQ